MLMLHAGAKPVEYEALRQLETPPATPSHVPIAHYRMVDLIKSTLGMYSHVVEEEHFGVTPDGMRFFGVLCLRSTYGKYTDMVGLRNSHDKRFPCAVSLGSKVFVCDNLAFSGDRVIRTKHTAKLKARLPGLITEIIEPLAEQREQQHRQLQLYQDTPLTDHLADAAIMQMFRVGVINTQRIPEVVAQWDQPVHDWGEKTAWRLFNAATYSLTGKVAENPKNTATLHKIIDGVCERVS